MFDMNEKWGYVLVVMAIYLETHTYTSCKSSRIMSMYNVLGTIYIVLLYSPRLYMTYILSLIDGGTLRLVCATRSFRYTTMDSIASPTHTT